MKNIRILASLTAVMAIVSLVCFIFARLALTDIFHGEPDVTLEWWIVSLSLLPIVLFHVLAFLTVLRVLGFLRNFEDS